MSRHRSPTVSIVVPTYNEVEYLQTCLDWVLQQDHPALEVIVVDGGSTDGTKQLLKDLPARMSDEVSVLARYDIAPDGSPAYVRESYPRYPSGRQLKILAYDHDIGANETYNQGFRQVTGEYCTYVVGDDYPALTMVSRMVAELERSGADFAYADTALVDDAGRILRIMRFPEYSFETCFADWYRLGVARLYRSRLHDEVGLFDARYQVANDYDMYLRFAMAGATFVHVPEVLYCVRNHGADRQTGQHTPERWSRIFEESNRCAIRAREWLSAPARS